MSSSSKSRALYLPFIGLGLLAVAWSGFWFMVKNRIMGGVDQWMVGEAAQGRVWTCPQTQVGGFPFRIEYRCEFPSFQALQDNLAVNGRLNRLVVVGQIYSPQHAIVEADGPLVVSRGEKRFEAQWDGFEASVRVRDHGLERASVVISRPRVEAGLVSGMHLLSASSESFEGHIRRNHARPVAEGAYDVIAQSRKLSFAPLDALTGNEDKADLEVQATLLHALLARSGTVEALEVWRAAGGRVDLVLLSLAKGPIRLQAGGQLQLDDQHRPSGEIKASGAGLDTVVQKWLGPINPQLGGLIGGLLTRRAEAAAQAGDEAGVSGQNRSALQTPALAPLPPLRLEDGRVFAGPFTIPNVRLSPLY